MMHVTKREKLYEKYESEIVVNGTLRYANRLYTCTYTMVLLHNFL